LSFQDRHCILFVDTLSTQGGFHENAYPKMGE
jgi:hypothetical protein